VSGISGVSAINPLITFSDIHGGKREVLYKKKQLKSRGVLSTTYPTIHFGLCTSLISKTLALISNCKGVALNTLFYKYKDKIKNIASSNNSLYVIR
jgi:hypothetical protein